MDKDINFIEYFPNDLKEIFKNLNVNELENLNEIIIINGQPLIVRINGKRCFLGKSGIGQSHKNYFYIDNDHIKKIFELVTKSSEYAYKRFIQEGFITLEGGHRVGIIGNYICDINNNPKFSEVNSFCFRINHDIYSNADIIIDDIVIYGNVTNTIIISPPGSGKTTLLRSIARLLSEQTGKIIMCNIVDERYEIAACTNGKANFNVGNSTSIISGCKKSIAIPMIVRSMTPDVILTDEIATEDDLNAIKYAVASGCRVIATAHGKDETCCILPLSKIHNLFQNIIILSSKNGPGTIEKIITGG